MNQMTRSDFAAAESLWEAALAAARAIPPAWPLEATVAVNPFLGQTRLSLAETSTLLGRLTGERLAMPRSWFAERLARGLMTEADIAEAFARHGIEGAPSSVAGQLAGPHEDEDEPDARIPDIATLAAQATGMDWPRLVAEWIAAFAAGYFDRGQALWAAPGGKGLYSAWRAHALHDLTPEIAGLKGFAAQVADMPLTASEAITRAGHRLGLGDRPGSYFHQLLLGLGGYAQYARHLLFVAERDGTSDDSLIDLLAIRLSFEVALFRQGIEAVSEGWATALAAHREALTPNRASLIDAALQEASERAAARRLTASLEWAAISGAVSASGPVERPFLQAAFCIDVRSEVYRRALETVDAGVTTLGFAGFFGMGVAHRDTGSTLAEHRLPVLLPASRFSCTAVQPEREDVIRLRARAVRAFGRFRQAAVSCFAFVEAMGPVYAGKLLGQSLRLPARRMQAAKPMLTTPPPLEERVSMAEGVLRAMSLTGGFARIVLIAGHGAGGVNNPFRSGLQCGACGGQAGDVNARLLALLLNDPDVRAGLSARGIAIPEDTMFLAGLHDTTTDEIELFLTDAGSSRHEAEIARLQLALKTAGRLSRMERAKRLPRSGLSDLRNRGRDWAETRPEWALAGCTAFIAAPRGLTAGQSLEGRAFLHDYVWQKDEGFRILELILTAPVVVASWINLQYFGSTVMPRLFGSGNKLLHNVVGGIGVVEGNGGLLRTGLPWQSVHDGARLMHDPLRLGVYVAAPEAAITDILARHPDLRALFDNGWMQLHALGPACSPTRRYAGNLGWEDAGA